jgi:ribosomal-protein-alanine N-acetyltransferase
VGDKLMALLILPMELKDIKEVLEIEKACYSTPWSRNSFISEINDNEDAYYFVARSGGRIAGYMGVWFILDEGHITNVAVHPDFRRQGVATSLFNFVFTVGKSKGVNSFTLEVRVSNFGAQRLYTKMGFVFVGVRKGYYQDNNEDAYIMWKNF